MKKTLLLASKLLLVCALLNSCYYDKEEEIYPTVKSGCDTTAVMSFEKNISPILKQNCTGCHGGQNPAGGYDFTDHHDAKLVADNGKLIGAISHEPSYSPMPKNGTKLTDCSIAQIKKWVDAGAPNN